MAYTLVDFMENDAKVSAVVPSCWLKDGLCYWSTSVNAVKDCMNKIPIKETWPAYEIIKTTFSDGRFY